MVHASGGCGMMWGARVVYRLLCPDHGPVWRWEPLDLEPRGVQGVVLGSGWTHLGSAIDGIIFTACQWLEIGH